MDLFEPFIPADPFELAATLDREQLVELFASLGVSPEAIGDAFVEARKKICGPPQPGVLTKIVEVDERLPPAVNASMSREEHANAAIQYREWFEGDGHGSERKPKTSPRSVLIVTQITGRREQEDQLAAPLPRGQARDFSAVTGFQKHSSKAPWSQLKPITFSDMSMRQVAFGRSLRCRIIALCSSLYSVQTVVEDEEGTTYDMSLYNYPMTYDVPPQDIDLVFPKGAVLLIREPVLMPSQQSPNPLVRVDSPTDIVVLAPYSQMLPDVAFSTPAPTSLPEPLEIMQTEDYWRLQGNELFKNSRWFPAAVAYSRGLALNQDSPVLRLNRAETYLRLGFFSGALHDLRLVLSAPDLPAASRNKALLRAARAEYGRRDFASAKQFFQQHKTFSSSNAEDAAWIRRCEDRLRESSSGTYNWARLFEESQRNSRLDVADYTGPVEVKKIPGRGRGLVATRDIAPGELLMVSKAISFVEEEDLRADIWRTALNIKTSRLMTRTQCANLPKLAQTIYGNPEIYEQVLHLYAGPDFPSPPATLPPPRREPQPVDPLAPTLAIDLGRIEAICLHNSCDQPSVRPTGPPVVEDSIHLSPNAIHLLPALLNHSCKGNARMRAFGDVLAVRAIARIRAGTEITVPYILPDAPYEARERALRRFFVGASVSMCDCALCALDMADGEDAWTRRAEVLARMPDTSAALFKQPLASLRGWEKELDATYRAPGRGAYKPALARVYHSLGEKLRADERTMKQALDANMKGLLAQGFVVTDAAPSASSAQAKRMPKDALPVDTSDLSMVVDVERGVIGMMRIAQHYRAHSDLVQAKRWLKAAQKVESIEFGGDKELFTIKEAAVLDGFRLRKFAQSVL